MKNLCSLVLVMLFSICLLAQHKIGLYTGSSHITGDVDAGHGLFNSGELLYAYQFSSCFRVESSVGFTRNEGAANVPWSSGVLRGGWPNVAYDFYWVPSYRNERDYVSVIPSYVWAGPLGIDRIGLLIGAGVGVYRSTTHFDLFDSDGNIYELIELMDGPYGRYSTEHHDGLYETQAAQNNNWFMYHAQVGMDYALKSRLDLSMRYRLSAADNDYLDGLKFRTPNDEINNVDFVFQLHFGLTYRL